MPSEDSKEYATQIKVTQGAINSSYLRFKSEIFPKDCIGDSNSKAKEFTITTDNPDITIITDYTTSHNFLRNRKDTRRYFESNNIKAGDVLFLYKKSDHQYYLTVERKTITEIHAKKDLKSRHRPVNTILYGPPGTGKTYRTKELAMSIISNLTITNSDPNTITTSQSLFKEIKRRILSLNTDINAEQEEVRLSFSAYSNLNKKVTKLAWITEQKRSKFVNVWVRRETDDTHYPDDIKNITKYKSDGGYNYPTFTVTNNEELEITLKMIEFALNKL